MIDVNLNELKETLYSDISTYKPTRMNEILILFLLNPGFKFMIIMRICSYFYSQNSKIFKIPFLIFYVIVHHYKIKYGINIPHATKIGKGFHIYHYGGIVVNSQSIIGENCSISHGVTIGNKGPRKESKCPNIGNNVYIGAGAKIIGDVRVGNNASIGANSVVTKNVPDNAIVGGIPAKILKQI